jgi:hypothetical protein
LEEELVSGCDVMMAADSFDRVTPAVSFQNEVNYVARLLHTIVNFVCGVVERFNELIYRRQRRVVDNWQLHELFCRIKDSQTFIPCQTGEF